jgi:hypothetical protein
MVVKAFQDFCKENSAMFWLLLSIKTMVKLVNLVRVKQIKLFKLYQGKISKSTLKLGNLLRFKLNKKSV